MIFWRIWWKRNCEMLIKGMIFWSRSLFCVWFLFTAAWTGIFYHRLFLTKAFDVKLGHGNCMAVFWVNLSCYRWYICSITWFNSTIWCFNRMHCYKHLAQVSNWMISTSFLQSILKTFQRVYLLLISSIGVTKTSQKWLSK